MRLPFFRLIILLFMVTGIANATVVRHLTVAEVAVPNVSASARQEALPKALAQVLIKVSGNPSIMTLPAFEDASDSIDDLIQSYTYVHQNQSDHESALLLKVTFDRKAIRQLLRQSGQAVWSANRPMTLLWLQTEDNNSPSIISNTADSQLLTAIHQTAEARGVPVLLPSMDLTDQNLLNTGISNFDSSLLLKAQQRYGAAAVLAGDIQQSGEEFQGSWLLLMNGAPLKWTNRADSMNNLIQSALNEMANLMANQLAVSNDKNLQTDVTIDVSNVNGLQDYSKVLSAFRHLPSVASVTVIDMDGSELLLRVAAVGGVDALSNAMAKQHQFSAEATNEVDNQQTKADLYYRWASSEEMVQPETQ